MQLFSTRNYRYRCKFLITEFLPVLRIRDVYPGSWFLPIPDPGSRIPGPGSRIPDPKTATKERGEKNLWCHTFLCSHKYHKIAHYFNFEVLKKKISANFQRIIELFTQNTLSKVWSWDPGSGKNLFRIADPGSRGQKGTGSRIRNTGSSKSQSRSIYFLIVCWVVKSEKLYPSCKKKV
jgi:hypothetical protein